jgi:hypothetical protein
MYRIGLPAGNMVVDVATAIFVCGYLAVFVCFLTYHFWKRAALELCLLSGFLVMNGQRIFQDASNLQYTSKLILAT